MFPASRAAVIHLEVGTGTLSWESLSCSRAWDDGVEGRAQIHKHDPGIGSCGVLEDVVEGQVYCTLDRGVQGRVCDGFEVGQHKVLKWLHYYRGQGGGSVLIELCGPSLSGDRDDSGGFEAG